MTANHKIVANIVGKKVSVGNGKHVFAKAEVHLTSAYDRSMSIAGVEDLEKIRVTLGHLHPEPTTKNHGFIEVTGVQQLRDLAEYLNKVADRTGNISVAGEGLDLI